MLARTSLTKDPPKWSAKSRPVVGLQASHFDSEKESSVHGQLKSDFRIGTSQSMFRTRGGNRPGFSLSRPSWKLEQ